MGVFDKMKKYFKERKLERQKENETTYIRLNHLERTVTDRDGIYNIRHTQGNVYELPAKMSCEQAFEVVSYVRDKVSKDLNLEKDGLQTMLITSSLLENYHFKKKYEYDSEDLVELTITRGKKYINFPSKSAVVIEEPFWYFDGISQNRVNSIYKNRMQRIDNSKITKESINKDTFCVLTEIIPTRDYSVM